GRACAVAGGHTTVERRVRWPALTGGWVRTVIIGTATAREGSERPAEANQATAERAPRPPFPAGWTSRSQHGPRLLRTPERASGQSNQRAQERGENCLHGIASSLGCRLR